MEEATKIIYGTTKLKKEWLKHKLVCGDMKGLGRVKFDLADEFKLDPMKIFYDSTAKSDVKIEAFAIVGPFEIECFNIKDIVYESKRRLTGSGQIQFCYYKWFKQHRETVYCHNINAVV